MEARELSLEEKKACIVHMIGILSAEKKIEDFICHCFSNFVDEKTDIKHLECEMPEYEMHIIFPELYNELKSLVEDDIDFERYNKNFSRTGKYFNEFHKSPVWYHDEREERINFLNDLNYKLK